MERGHSKEWLGRRYSKQEVNVGIAFLNERISELLRVNLLLTSLIIQCFRISEAYWKNFTFCQHQKKKHKKVFPEVQIVEFRNGKSLKDYLVRAALLKMDNSGGSEPCGNGTCQVCDHIVTTNTFTTKVCGEVFKIQIGPLNCNSGKVLYLLRCKNL